MDENEQIANILDYAEIGGSLRSITFVLWPNGELGWIHFVLFFTFLDFDVLKFRRSAATLCIQCKG